jgi:Flp pilus assembly protein CpaB
VEILVTSNRVEEGAAFEATMFVREQRPPEQIPEGAIRADELSNVVGRFALNLINANTPMLWEYVTEVRPMNTLQIPPGYRAVTIYVDSRRGIEGWAKPNSRVDILWTFTDRDGRRKVATIVRYCKILSVAGVTQGREKVAIQGGKTTVTLLVTERDARKIELARTSGSLSLSLVGEREDVRDDEGQTEIIDLTSIIDRPRDERPEVQQSPADGVMYTKDPKTGQHIRFELRNGRWRRAIDG